MYIDARSRCGRHALAALLLLASFAASAAAAAENALFRELTTVGVPLGPMPKCRFPRRF